MADDITDAVYEALFAPEPQPVATPVPYEPDPMEGSIFNEPIIDLNYADLPLERPMFSLYDLTPIGDILEGAYSFLEGNNLGTAAAILSAAIPGTIKIKGGNYLDNVIDTTKITIPVKKGSKRAVEPAVKVTISKDTKDLYEQFLKGKK